jgi:hypothetical protein
MTELEAMWRRAYPVVKQLASEDVRRKALATLRAGDFVQAVDTETGEATFTGRVVLPDAPLLITNGRRERWFSAAGVECDSEGQPRTGGRVLIRPWVTAAEAERLWLEDIRRPGVQFTWGLYEQHMEATWAAVVSGADEMPEAPWD